MTDPAHAITSGIADFEMLDEAYDNMDIDAGAHIFITSDYPKITPAVAWTWTYDDKRVLSLQPGHGILGLPANHGLSSLSERELQKTTYARHSMGGRMALTSHRTRRNPD